MSGPVALLWALLRQWGHCLIRRHRAETGYDPAWRVCWLGCADCAAVWWDRTAR